ncbi:hypothetical protein SAMN05443270_2993 [Lacrimispora sphenoides]|uniref:hypothetical protein n=1 Tax=Lacrimispora sphenoides TaxID=29370 RepID=UPI0008BED8CA|nr:hypothetical protein [Lacrimispora sphenoides]SEU08011.1 hypothetical protein SAMN05443270_2993 [Lacrimispora sphenoides]
MATKNYGTIAIIPDGEWVDTKQYKVGRVVSYNGSSYLVHTLPPIGTLPTNTNYYQLSAQGGGVATEDSPGVVKPDNISIKINEIGTISAKKATQTEFGITTSGDGTKVGSDGKMNVDTNFQQATKLANLIANEAWSIILGKISKSIATTMDLDENALLKAMISNQFENITTKAASAALAYNLKQSITDLNSNLNSLFKKINYSGTTDASGNVLLDLPYTGNHIVSVKSATTAITTETYHSQSGKWGLHCELINGDGVAKNAYVEGTVFYIAS